MFKNPENEYQYVYHEKKFYVMSRELYIEYKNIPRDTSTNNFTSKVNPYKFSVAMLSRFRKRIYVTLTNYEFEYDIGFKQDWILFKDGVDEGIRMFEDLIEKMKQKPKKKRKRFIIV